MGIMIAAWVIFFVIMIIVDKSSHFSFLAKKRRKFQIPREECEEIAKEKKLKIILVSKLQLKLIILYFKFWLLKTSIRGNFNYKYFHPSFLKYPFSKIKSSIASSLSKDLFLGVTSYILDLKILKIFFAKKASFSLRRIFLAKIFFLAKNSSLALHYSLYIYL